MLLPICNYPISRPQPLRDRRSSLAAKAKHSKENVGIFRGLVTRLLVAHARVTQKTILGRNGYHLDPTIHES